MHISLSSRVRGSGRTGTETWLGSLGTLSAIKYSWNEPGGCATLNATLQCDPNLRHEALTPGRVITAWAGGCEQWKGFLDTAEPGENGYSLSAKGIGSAGNDARAYATGNGYFIADEIAGGIARGVLPWKPAPSYPTGMYGFAERATTTITEVLEWAALWNSGRWTIDANGQLEFPPPLTSPTRMILANSTAGGRTLEDYVNVLIAKYNGANNVPFIVSTGDLDSIAEHGRREDFVDFTSLGITTEANVKDALDKTIARFGHRARWSGSFTCSRGMVRTINGSVEEPCAVRPGNRFLVQVIAPDQAGEVDPMALSFIGGETSYDADSDTVVITPQESAARSLSDVLIQPKVTKAAS